MAVAAAAAAAAAGLRGKRFKRAPQTRRTSPDQPPSPTPPSCRAPLRPVGSASSAQPRGPGRRLGGFRPSSLLAEAAGPARVRGGKAGPGQRQDLAVHGQTRWTRAQPWVKLALSFPAPRGSQSAPHLPSHPTPLQGNLSAAGTGQGQGYSKPPDLSARSSAGTDAQLAFICSS